MAFFGLVAYDGTDSDGEAQEEVPIKAPLNVPVVEKNDTLDDIWASIASEPVKKVTAPAPDEAEEAGGPEDAGVAGRDAESDDAPREEAPEEEEPYDWELEGLSVAQQRAVLLQRRLAANTPAAAGPSLPGNPLPLIDQAFGGVRRGQLPKYLDPEATRLLPGQSSFGYRALPGVRDEAVAAAASGRVAPPRFGEEGFDVASLAPRLADEKKRPSGAVISAAPKRARLEEDEGVMGGMSEMQLAVLGLEKRPRGGAEGGPDPGLGPVPPKGNKPGGKAMPIDDFMAKGGGAKLPRKGEHEKDKEKARRMKGQSTFDRWKSEEEFSLRQFYDS